MPLSKLYTNYALCLLAAIFVSPALSKDSGYFGCDFVDNKVTAVYFCAPAMMAGIKVSDRIIAINRQTVTAKNSATTLALLQGEPGSSVEVTVLRQGKKLTFTVVRAALPRPVFVSHQTAEEYYIDGMRQLDCGYIPTARLALEEAESMGHKMATLSLKTLMPKQDPDKTELLKIKTIKELLKLRQWQKAHQASIAALKSAAQSETLLLLAAYSARQAGKYKQATELAQRLATLNNQYQPGLIELAYCQVTNGQKVKARDTWQKASLLNEANPELPLLRDYLKLNEEQHHQRYH